MGRVLTVLGAILCLGAWTSPAFSGTNAYSAWSVPSDPASAVLVYNEDQLEGQWKQFKGDLKKKWADLTDDDILYIEGKKDKLEGKIQERYGDRKEEVEKWVDEWFEAHSPGNRPAND